MIFFTNAFRIFFAFLDGILFNFFIMVYNLFYKMIEINIFDNSMMEKFSSRIYFMLGLFMLLKLSFSFLSYAVNPDNISNKDTGVGKLITNTFVVLILIGTTPFIFSRAMDLQKIIIKDNIIPNIILGVAPEKLGSDFQKSAGANMAFKIAYSVIKPNIAELPSLSAACSEPTISNSLNKISGSELTSECYDALDTVSKSDLSADRYKLAISSGNYGHLYAWEVYTGIAKNGKDIYVFDYLALISTLVIGAMVLLFIGFTMDVALRMIKLGFLQLIAPVAIISYIDPKSSKSGIFGKWVKASVGTYADLFMRLIAVNFAIFIVGLASDMKNNAGDDGLIFVFIMIGAFMFAKQLPGLLSDILGIKLGDFNLNPLKKIPPGAGAILGGAAGSVLGAGTSALSRMQASRNLGQKGWQQGLAAVTGAGIGLVGGGLAGGKGGLKGQYLAPGFKYGAGQGAQYLKQDGSSIFGRTAARVAKSVGLNDSYENKQRNLDALEKAAGIKDQLQNAAMEDSGVRTAKRDLDDAIASGIVGDKYTPGTIAYQREQFENQRDSYIARNWNNEKSQVGAAAADYNRTIGTLSEDVKTKAGLDLIDGSTVVNYSKYSGQAKTAHTTGKADPSYISAKAAHDSTGGTTGKSTAGGKS
jgi:hypothetical protein